MGELFFFKYCWFQMAILNLFYVKWSIFKANHRCKFNTTRNQCNVFESFSIYFLEKFKFGNLIPLPQLPPAQRWHLCARAYAFDAHIIHCYAVVKETKYKFQTYWSLSLFIICPWPKFKLIHKKYTLLVKIGNLSNTWLWDLEKIRSKIYLIV